MEQAEKLRDQFKQNRQTHPSITDVPVVAKGMVAVGRRRKVTMSCDHRALDGLMGAQFLKEFKRVLEHPQELAASTVKP